MASVETVAPGSVFSDRFRIVELLAEGEMGTAYLADVLPKGTRCVLKTMGAALVKPDAMHKVFVSYAKSTSRVTNANVLQTLDAGIDRASGRPWFTMDLLRGEDLVSRVARKGALPLSEVRFLLAALAEVLREAHEHGLVHYDLAPENIHLAPGHPFMLKVRELTISRFVSEALAAQGEIVGTAIWMPPEQFDLGRRLTPAANAWSLALLGFYAATGRPYWTRESDAPLPSKELLREILASPIIAASQRAKALGCASALPPWFDEWFDRCLVREPHKRLTSAGAARAMVAEDGARRDQAATGDDVDDQATTLQLPHRSRIKGSRSVPLGILAEAQGRPAATAPTRSPARLATVDPRESKSRGGGRWWKVAALFAAAAFLLWALRDHLPKPAGAGSAAESDQSERQPPSPSALTRSESFAPAKASPPASGSAGLNAAPPAEASVRTFGTGDSPGGSADYDLSAALKVLNGVYYGNCAVPSAGKLAITFAPNGRVKRVAVLRGDYDAATTECITARFGSARMSPFRGGDQSVTAEIVATH